MLTAGTLSLGNTLYPHPLPAYYIGSALFETKQGGQRKPPVCETMKQMELQCVSKLEKTTAEVGRSKRKGKFFPNVVSCV